MMFWISIIHSLCFFNENKYFLKVNVYFQLFLYRVQTFWNLWNAIWVITCFIEFKLCVIFICYTFFQNQEKRCFACQGVFIPDIKLFLMSHDDQERVYLHCKFHDPWGSGSCATIVPNWSL